MLKNSKIKADYLNRNLDCFSWKLHCKNGKNGQHEMFLFACLCTTVVHNHANRNFLTLVVFILFHKVTSKKNNLNSNSNCLLWLFSFKANSDVKQLFYQYFNPKYAQLLEKLCMFTRWGSHSPSPCCWQSELLTLTKALVHLLVQVQTLVPKGQFLSKKIYFITHYSGIVTAPLLIEV